MRTHYLIFIRPPGSNIWTLWTKKAVGTVIPWITFDVNLANDAAQRIASESHYCAIVKKVETPKEPDTEKYALLADGETKFIPT